MSGHPPLPQELRDAIAAAIQHGIDTGDLPSQRALANQFGVSVSSIYRIAGENDLADAWEDRRYRTEAANATNATRLAEKRLRLQEQALDAASDWLDRRDDTFQVVTKTMEGTAIDDVAPGPHEWKATGQAVQALSTTAVGLARLDTELTGTGNASGILDDIEIGLRAAREAREAASRAGEM